MKKCPKNVEKVHNFLDLPPRRIKTIWIWGKMMFDDDKLYQTDTSGLFLSYISHVCTKCCLYLTNITTIWHTIRDIFQSFEFGNNLKIWNPPPTSQNSLYFELWTFRFSALTPTPLLDFFHIFGTFLVLIASLSLKISLKHHKKIVSPPYLMFYACFFIFNYYRSLSIAIVLKYHFHYHYHYRSKSHYRTSLHMPAYARDISFICLGIP